MARREFLLEGTRAIEEAERAGIKPALVFYEPGLLVNDPRGNRLLEKLAESTRDLLEVNLPIANLLSQTETAQGIIAVYPFPELPVPDSPSLVLILDSMRDPGNLGTILRTAWAAAVDAVLLTPGTVDPYNPKVVRAGIGAHFSVPIAWTSWQDLEERLRGIPRVYLADAQGDNEYDKVDWSPPVALILGGEAEGASAQALALSKERIAIPMPGRTESLNAAVAAGILLFQATRSQVRTQH